MSVSLQWRWKGISFLQQKDFFPLRIGPNMRWHIDRRKNEESADVMKSRKRLMLSCSIAFNFPIKKAWGPLSLSSQQQADPRMNNATPRVLILFLTYRKIPLLGLEYVGSSGVWSATSLRLFGQLAYGTVQVPAIHHSSTRHSWGSTVRLLECMVGTVEKIARVSRIRRWGLVFVDE